MAVHWLRIERFAFITARTLDPNEEVSLLEGNRSHTGINQIYCHNKE